MSHLFGGVVYWCHYQALFDLATIGKVILHSTSQMYLNINLGKGCSIQRMKRGAMFKSSAEQVLSYHPPRPHPHHLPPSLRFLEPPKKWLRSANLDNKQPGGGDGTYLLRYFSPTLRSSSLTHTAEHHHPTLNPSI